MEQAVNAKLGATMQDAQAALLARFGNITLESLSQEIDSRGAPRADSPAPNPAPPAAANRSKGSRAKRA